MDILIVVKDKNRRAPILGQATIANKNGVFSSRLAKAEIKDPQAVLRGYLCHFFKSDAYIQAIKAQQEPTHFFRKNTRSN